MEFPIMDATLFIQLCSVAISQNDSLQLQFAVNHFAEYCFMEPTDAVVQEETVIYLNDTFRSSRFHEMSGSYYLMLLLEYNWAAFSQEQRDQLLDAIEFSFNKFSDPMSWFVISEILGEYYCNEQSFKVLKRFAKLPEEGPRSQAPHGLEHIAKSAINPEIRSQAIHQIRNLLDDPSQTVKEEASTSIHRLRVTNALMD